MAQIKITGVEGSITISNDRALGLAADKKNLPLTQQKEMWVELGTWQGYLSNVKSILIEKQKEYNEDYNRPPTAEESIARRKIAARIGESRKLFRLPNPTNTKNQ